ncbi:hypothetical protein TWF481_003545 [Arthrobotrys musiformis]|uniref:Uncharacterized protein n=1 Tax=Arthrobotrys musiformis TaxID=47236 RepID=A0AAV9WHD1_9PEZI
MWFESQFKEQRNYFQILWLRAFVPTPFMTLTLALLLFALVPLAIRYLHQGFSKTAFTDPLAGQAQEALETYQNNQAPSREAPCSQVNPISRVLTAATTISNVDAPSIIPPSVSAPALLPPQTGETGEKATPVGYETTPELIRRPQNPIKYRYTPENPHHMCINGCLPPTVTGPAPSKCTHPNHIRQAPHGSEFELVSIDDGLGRFDTVPMMGVLEQWEQDRILCPDSIVSCHTNTYLSTLTVQSSCYSYEQVLYCNVIACMLEIFEVHAPKMLRNKKKIGGSYYYHLCEMLREPDNQAAVATFMMTVSLGKRAEMLATKNPWGPECMKPSILSLWNLFHALIEISDEELDETIESWARTAKEWSLAMIYLKMAHKRLWQESPLYLTGADIYDSKSDSEKVQSYVQKCLRAGDDTTALACQSLASLRQEVLSIHRQLDGKLNDCKALKKMTPYDIDLLKFYTATLGQLCTTGNTVNALVAWRDHRNDGMKKIRALAIERKNRDLTMQELTGPVEANSEQEQSDSELSSRSSASDAYSASSYTSVSDRDRNLAVEIKTQEIEAILGLADGSPNFDFAEDTKAWENGVLL